VYPNLNSCAERRVRSIKQGGVPPEVVPFGKSSLLRALSDTERPYMAVATCQAEIIMRIASEFGFTPAGRSKIATPPGDNQTQFDILDRRSDDTDNRSTDRDVRGDSARPALFVI
jgi:hypothetical protein